MALTNPQYRKPKQIFVVCAVIAVTTLARLIFYPMTPDMLAVFGVLFVAALAGMGIMWRDMKRDNAPPQ